MTKFPGMGFYRGDLDALLEDSMKTFNALPPEKQEEIRKAQRESWVKGEMALGNDAQEAEARAEFAEKKEDE